MQANSTVKPTFSSRLRGTFSDPRRAMIYRFTSGSGSHLVVWTADGWRCVSGYTNMPLQPSNEAEAADMRDAEAQAAALWDAENPQRLRIVA